MGGNKKTVCSINAFRFFEFVSRPKPKPPHQRKGDPTCTIPTDVETARTDVSPIPKTALPFNPAYCSPIPKEIGHWNTPKPSHTPDIDGEMGAVQPFPAKHSRFFWKLSHISGSGSFSDDTSPSESGIPSGTIPGQSPNWR